MSCLQVDTTDLVKNPIVGRKKNNKKILLIFNVKPSIIRNKQHVYKLTRLIGSPI